MWAVVLKSTLFTVPVTVAVLDVFGYVARVEGASMQVLSFSTETVCHIVFELMVTRPAVCIAITNFNAHGRRD